MRERERVKDEMMEGSRGMKIVDLRLVSMYHLKRHPIYREREKKKERGRQKEIRVVE